jgi:hypothetical protein
MHVLEFLNGLLASWVLKKSTGTSQYAFFAAFWSIWLGASPLFQRAAQVPIGHPAGWKSVPFRGTPALHFGRCERLSY